MIDEVESLDEDFRTYASFKAIEEMDENDFGAVSENGSIEDIKKITLEDLNKAYETFLNDSQIEISMVVKDYDEKLTNLIKKYALFTNNENKDLKPYRSIIKTNKEFEEEKEFSQSALVCIYRLDDLSEREKNITAFLFNEILGGGGLDTRLNSSLRGDNSICYFCNSSFEKFDNKITITTLVSKENISKAKKLIVDVVDSMKKISTEEVDKNLKKIITTFDELKNSSQFLLVNQLLSDLGFSYTTEERVELLKSVTPEELEKVANKMNLNMVYVLKGVKENG
jgi:predicted Zn-dependent peptidase